jgi:DNA-binding CsgD family transcriptional regulator/PAS domain-containing protein
VNLQSARAAEKEQPGAFDREEEMEVEEFSELIGLIYDGAFDPGAWPVMLNRLAERLSAKAAGILSLNSNTNAVAMTAPQIDPEALRSFTEYWASHDFVWKGWAKPEGIGSSHRHERSGGRAAFDGGRGLSSLCQGRDFDATERRLFGALVPHLQRAVQLRLRLPELDELPEGSAEILNRLSQGIILVDGEARMIFANHAAEGILRTGRGMFHGRDGPRAEIPDETRRLRRIIAECAEPRRELGAAGGRLRLSREQGLPLIVFVAPHRAGFGWIDVVRPRAMLFIGDPEATAGVHWKWLREDFGLTPAEAAVAIEVLEADGLQATARRLRISLATARTHLAHVFDKTGTRRQAELVRLLLQSASAVRED